MCYYNPGNFCKWENFVNHFLCMRIFWTVLNLRYSTCQKTHVFPFCFLSISISVICIHVGINLGRKGMEIMCILWHACVVFFLLILLCCNNVILASTVFWVAVEFLCCQLSWVPWIVLGLALLSVYPGTSLNKCFTVRQGKGLVVWYGRI